MDRYTFVAVIGMGGARIVGEGQNKFLAMNFGIKTRIPDGKGGHMEVWKNVEGTWNRCPEGLVQYLLPKTKVLVDMVNPQPDVYRDNTGKEHLKIRGSITQVELLASSPWPTSNSQQQVQPQQQATPPAKNDDLPF